MKPVIDLAHILMILQRETEHKLNVNDAVQLYRIDPELSEETLKNAAKLLGKGAKRMMFQCAKNIESNGFVFVEEVGAELEVFTLAEPSGEEWNKRAFKQNTKLFIEEFNRVPENYKEVLAWARSIGQENKRAISMGTI